MKRPYTIAITIGVLLAGIVISVIAKQMAKDVIGGTSGSLPFSSGWTSSPIVGTWRIKVSETESLYYKFDSDNTYALSAGGDSVRTDVVRGPWRLRGQSLHLGGQKIGTRTPVELDFSFEASGQDTILLKRGNPPITIVLKRE